MFIAVRGLNAYNVIVMMKKQTLIKIIISIAATMVFLLALTLVLPLVIDAIKDRGNDVSSEIIKKDLSNDAAYLALDRNIYYNEYGYQVPIDPDDPDAMGSAAAFFYNYFKALTDGDSDAFAACFSDRYKNENKIAESFAAQGIYDIYVTLYERTSSNDGINQTFIVRFKIYKNDGTLFDVSDEKTYTTVFKLITDDGELVINDVLKYKVG